MKVKNAKLEWNVLEWDDNKKEVENYNIFRSKIYRRNTQRNSKKKKY